MEVRRQAQGPSKPSLRVGFADFWPNFQRDENYFYRVLSLKYDVVLEQKRPSVLFYSVFGDRHRSFTGAKKIHFTGEWHKSVGYDYSLSFDPDGVDNCRLPLWVLYIDWFGLSHPNNCSPSFLVPLESLVERRYEEKPKFCNFVYARETRERVSSLRLLNGYKTVDSAGALANSIGYLLRGDEKTKMDFLKRYRFTIAFENTCLDGYVTEKILHPLAAGSVPIYWGSSAVLSDFNPDSFLYAGDSSDFRELVERVRQIEENGDLRRRYMTAPAFRDGSLERFRPQAVAERLASIIG